MEKSKSFLTLQAAIQLPCLRPRKLVRTSLILFMLYQLFLNLNFMKLREYFLCAKKTKIMTQTFLLFSTAHWREYHGASNSDTERKLLNSRYLFLDFIKIFTFFFRRSYGVGTTWEWVNDVRIFIFGWSISLSSFDSIFGINLITTKKRFWLIPCKNQGYNSLLTIEVKFRVVKLDNIL